MNRQLKQLLILALILIGALAYAYFRYPSQKSVSGAIDLQPPRPREGQTSPSPGGLAELSLDFDQGTIGPFNAPKRDIFGSLYTVTKVKPKPKPVIKPQPVARPKPVIMPEPVVISTPAEVSKPLANFTLLGYLDKDGARTVFLGLPDEIFILQQGDSFAGDYQVAELTVDRLLIRRTADNREILIRLEKPDR